MPSSLVVYVNAFFFGLICLIRLTMMRLCLWPGVLRKFVEQIVCLDGRVTSELWISVLELNRNGRPETREK